MIEAIYVALTLTAAGPDMSRPATFVDESIDFKYNFPTLQMCKEAMEMVAKTRPELGDHKIYCLADRSPADTERGDHVGPGESY